MYVIRLSILILLLTTQLTVQSQSSQPRFVTVTTEFFKNYSHDPEKPYDRIRFAKKKDGWHVQVIDLTNDDSVKSTQKFWSSADKKYKRLTGFGAGLSGKEINDKIHEQLDNEGLSLFYSYERCPYYGYEEWDSDVIRDYGRSVSLSDTALEGLARAYSNYAQRFMWRTQGGRADKNDINKSALSPHELPSATRIDSFLFHTEKSNECYRKLVKSNPNYRMLVGSARMKLLNEQFYQYQELMIANQKSKAAAILAAMEPGDTIYQNIGESFLAGCAPNSILITFGDNDTYPLWYVQEKKGFRKDVTVLNMSMLYTFQYIHQLKRDKLVDFSTTDETLRSLPYEYFFYDDKGSSDSTRSSLAALLEDIQKSRYKVQLGDGSFTNAFRVKNVDIEVSPDKFEKVSNQTNISPSISVKLGSFLPMNDFIILDIVQSTLYERPVYFTSQEATPFNKRFLQREGIVYRLMPLDPVKQVQQVAFENKQLEGFVANYYRPAFIQYSKEPLLFEDIMRVHTSIYTQLINFYLSINDKETANEWAKRYISSMAGKPLRQLYGFNIAEVLLKTDYQKEAVQLMEEMAQHEFKAYRTQSILDLYVFSDKEMALSSLNYLTQLLDSHELSSEKIKKMIDELEKD